MQRVRRIQEIMIDVLIVEDDSNVRKLLKKMIEKHDDFSVSFEASGVKEAIEFYQNNPVELVMMDIDNFKSVNDTYGHDNGDTVLIRLGEILKEISRVNGFAGRFGGEEFMIFLFGEDTSIQAHIINQVCKKLRETDFSFTDRQITLSVGVTDIKNGDTLEECIERADKALYYSKQNGKNQVNWYEEVIDKK